MIRLRQKLDGSVVVLAVLLAATWMALPSQSRAQTGTGTVTGTVMDPNKTVIPAADVTITATLTNISHKTQSNNVGIYYFGDLPRKWVNIQPALTTERLQKN